MGVFRSALKCIFVSLMIVVLYRAFVPYPPQDWPTYAEYEEVYGPLTESEKYSAVDRFAVHVSVDKHIYRPGDQLRFRNVLLDANLRPYYPLPHHYPRT